MGFLYIILSLLCRLFAADRILRASGSLRYKSLNKGRDELNCYAIWLPILGWYSVWTRRALGSRNRLEIVRIERGDHQHPDRYEHLDRPANSGHSGHWPFNRF